jgi:hypothetical protein
MLFHASIPADDPEHVASVIADLWRGDFTPFPPYPGSFIAFADDERGSEIEVMPRRQEQIPEPSEVGLRETESPSPYSSTHLAVATPLGEDEIYAIAAREGWIARRCSRGGVFDVVEFWLENKFMLELLTAAEQQRYLAFMKPKNFRALFDIAS